MRKTEKLRNPDEENVDDAAKVVESNEKLRDKSLLTKATEAHECTNVKKLN